jgi:hypothetical protein
VHDFNKLLTVVPLKQKFAKKLAFMCELKPWVEKIIYQQINISDICQSFMKMVECMEDEGLLCH